MVSTPTISTVYHGHSAVNTCYAVKTRQQRGRLLLQCSLSLLHQHLAQFHVNYLLSTFTLCHMVQMVVRMGPYSSMSYKSKAIPNQSMASQATKTDSRFMVSSKDTTCFLLTTYLQSHIGVVHSCSKLLISVSPQAYPQRRLDEPTKCKSPGLSPEEVGRVH